MIFCLCSENACLEIRGRSWLLANHRSQAVRAHALNTSTWEAHTFNPSLVAHALNSSISPRWSWEVIRLGVDRISAPFELRKETGRKQVAVASGSLIFQVLTPISDYWSLLIKTNEDHASSGTIPCSNKTTTELQAKQVNNSTFSSSSCCCRWILITET